MSPTITTLLFEAIRETLLIVGASTVLTALLGIPLGMLAVGSGQGHLFAHPTLNRTSNGLITAVHSTPFVIFLVALIPLIKQGTDIAPGPWAAIALLTVAVFPLVAHQVRSALGDVNFGLIDAARMMGASPRQIVLKILLPEALPGITAGLAFTTVTLISYAAIVGTIGGGKLGELALGSSGQGHQPLLTALAVVTLVLLVQGIRKLDLVLARKLDKRPPRVSHLQ